MHKCSTRTTRNVAGTFKVIAFLPEGFGEPVYRIEHVDTDHRQIARRARSPSVIDAPCWVRG